MTQWAEHILSNVVGDYNEVDGIGDNIKFLVAHNHFACQNIEHVSLMISESELESLMKFGKRRV